MPSIEIELTGLFLLVRSPKAETVHVLAPEMQDEHSERLDVRLLHHSFHEPEGHSLKGWALVLGAEPGTADTTLQANNPAQGEIADLSVLTGRKVPRERLSNIGTPEIAARITLRAGRAIRAAGHTKWQLDEQEIVLAETLTWRIEDVPDELHWNSMGASEPPPVHSLRELAPDDAGLIRLRITHLPKNPPSSSNPAAAEEYVQEHFRAYYRLFGHNFSGGEPIPRLVGKQAGPVMPMLATGDDDTDDW